MSSLFFAAIYACSCLSSSDDCRPACSPGACSSHLEARLSPERSRAQRDGPPQIAQPQAILSVATWIAASSVGAKYWANTETRASNGLGPSPSFEWCLYADTFGLWPPWNRCQWCEVLNHSIWMENYCKVLSNSGLAVSVCQRLCNLSPESVGMKIKSFLNISPDWPTVQRPTKV